MNVIERRMCNVLKKQSVRGYSNCLIKKKKKIKEIIIIHVKDKDSNSIV